MRVCQFRHFGLETTFYRRKARGTRHKGEERGTRNDTKKKTERSELHRSFASLRMTKPGLRMTKPVDPVQFTVSVTMVDLAIAPDTAFTVMV